jgi:hypothetical protein
MNINKSRRALAVLALTMSAVVVAVCPINGPIAGQASRVEAHRHAIRSMRLAVPQAPRKEQNPWADMLLG